VLVPVRNRSGARLHNCLSSLRWQRQLDGAAFAGDALEILVIDTGSDVAHAREIASTADRLGARLVRSDYTGTWNRSLALNIGIRASTGHHVMCTDVDMVFRDDFVAAALRILTATPSALVVCRCHDLPPGLAADRLQLPADIFPLAPETPVRGHGGTGACQIAGREFFEHARGYDEGYRYWGSEDKDLFARAVRHGLIVQWLDRHTVMAHQWHAPRRDDRWLRVRWNRWRYRLTSRRVVKNPSTWGAA
jgi:glycosyltransferase involved in cell wall biosynthesis